MPKRPDDLYLVDLIEACQDARRFVRGRSAEDWYDDDVARWAVLARLATVGEAARRLSPELCARWEGIAWRRLVGFRNVAVHEYFAVEWHVVWTIVDRQMPELISYATEMLCAEYPDLVRGVARLGPGFRRAGADDEGTGGRRTGGVRCGAVPPIVLRWTPQRVDFDDAMAVYRRALGARAIVLTYLPAISLLLFALCGLLLGAPVIGATAAVAAAVVAVFAPRINNRAVWRNPLARQPMEASAGPTALRVSAPTATTDWQWQTFDRAVETRRNFVLLGRPAATGKRTQLFCYLPKAALPHPDEEHRLRALPGAVLPGGVRAA